MANELPADPVQALWQGQEPKGLRMSLDELRKRAEAVRWRVRRRTDSGLTVIYSVIAYFGLMFFVFPNAMARIGLCLTIAACPIRHTNFIAGAVRRFRSSQAVSRASASIERSWNANATSTSERGSGRGD